MTTPAGSSQGILPQTSIWTRSTRLAEDLRDRLAALDRAEQRLAAGTYGLSVQSGKPIPDERLEAFPTAERTVEEERALSTGRGG